MMPPLQATAVVAVTYYVYEFSIYCETCDLSNLQYAAAICYAFLISQPLLEIFELCIYTNANFYLPC